MKLIRLALALITVLSLSACAVTPSSKPIKSFHVSFHDTLPDKEVTFFAVDAGSSLMMVSTGNGNFIALPGNHSQRPQILRINPYYTNVREIFTQNVEDAINQDGRYKIASKHSADAYITVKILSFNFISSVKWKENDGIAALGGVFIVRDKNGKRIWEDRLNTTYKMDMQQRFQVHELSNNSKLLDQALEQGAKIAMEKFLANLDLTPKSAIDALQ